MREEPGMEVTVGVDPTGGGGATHYMDYDRFFLTNNQVRNYINGLYSITTHMHLTTYFRSYTYRRVVGEVGL